MSTSLSLPFHRYGSFIIPYTTLTSGIIYIFLYITHIYTHIYTASKKNIEHFTIFRSKYISKGAVDLKFSPDVGNNPSNPYIQRKQNKQVQKLSYV